MEPSHMKSRATRRLITTPLHLLAIAAIGWMAVGATAAIPGTIPGATTGDVAPAKLAANGQATPAEIDAIASQFFAMIDLHTPGLEKAAAAWQHHDAQAALDAYRDALMAHMVHRPMDTYPQPGDTHADALMRGEITQYRSSGGMSINQIGQPGAIDWFKATIDKTEGVPTRLSATARASDDSDFATHLAGMYEFGALATAYAHTHDAKYARYWAAVWEDFALRHHPGLQSMKARKVNLKVYHALPASWALFYCCSRQYSFWNSLITLAKAMSPAQYRDIPSASLARSLMLIGGENNAVILKAVVKAGGVPNQHAGGARRLVQNAMDLLGAKDAPTWLAAADKFFIHYYAFVNMPDGTSTEQAFNYNKANATGIRALALEFGDKQPDWLKAVVPAGTRTMRFLACSLRNGSHAGAFPRLGTDDRLQESLFRLLLPALPDEQVARIVDRVYGHDKLPPPSFTSVQFPYGGYYIMRTGWTRNDAYLFFKASRRPLGHHRDDNTAIHFLCAYGRDLLIDSGITNYNPQDPINKYVGSSWSKNTIQVDGCGQHIATMGQPGIGPDTTAAKPIHSRWLTGNQFDFAEGCYEFGYTNPDIHVRHERQILFLRHPLIWIVTDRMRGLDHAMPANEKHTYTQTWNFPTSFAKNQVQTDPGEQVIRTTDPAGPNVVLHNFGATPVTYTEYYGQKSPQWRGWVNIHKPVPAVDVHATWTGRGEQLLVTAIDPCHKVNDEPMRSIKSFHSADPNIRGFDAVLTDGSTVAYRAALNTADLTAGTVHARGSVLLVTRSPDGTVHGVLLDATSLTIASKPLPLPGDNFEFTLRGNRLLRTTLINYPPNPK